MAPRSRTPQRTAVLLRGVNVGGHKLPMTVFRSTLEATGCADVVTYIQSGNAVVTPPESGPADLAVVLREAVSAAAGYDVPVVLRTRAELARLVDVNPYPDAAGTRLHVVFFAEPPPAGVLDRLDPDQFRPEECALVGRDLYLHLPDGMGRAKLPVALEKAGRRANPVAVGTSRNWNTVTKLLALAGG